jgi:hypothetical protein
VEIALEMTAGVLEFLKKRGKSKTPHVTLSAVNALSMRARTGGKQEMTAGSGDIGNRPQTSRGIERKKIIDIEQAFH